MHTKQTARKSTGSPFPRIPRPYEDNTFEDYVSCSGPTFTPMFVPHRTKQFARKSTGPIARAPSLLRNYMSRHEFRESPFSLRSKLPHKDPRDEVPCGSAGHSKRNRAELDDEVTSSTSKGGRPPKAKKSVPKSSPSTSKGESADDEDEDEKYIPPVTRARKQPSADM